MANQVDIQLRVLADLAQLKALQSQFEKFQASTLTFGKLVGADLVAGWMRDLGQGLIQATTAGIQFNATLEQTQLGVAALFRQFAPQTFATFDTALTASAGIMEDLKKAATATTASFDDLARTYKTIAGAAFAAGIPLERQVKLTLLLAQTVAGLGLPADQLAQESRALLTGNIDRSAYVAKTLGITGADIAREKAAGTLFEFLSKKLQPFAEAGERAAKTFDGAASNLRDVIQQLSGRAMGGVNTALTAAMLKLTEQLQTPQMLGLIDSLAEQLGEFAKVVPGLVQYLPEFGASLKSLGEVVGMFVAVRAAFALKNVITAIPALYTGLNAALETWVLSASSITSLFARSLGLVGAVAFGGYKVGEAISPWFERAVGTDTLALGLGFLGQKTGGLLGLDQHTFGSYLAGTNMPDQEALHAENVKAAEERQSHAEAKTKAQQMDLETRLKLGRDALEFDYQQKLITLEQFYRTKREFILQDQAIQDEADRKLALQNLDQFLYTEQHKRAGDLFGQLKAPEVAGADRGFYQSAGAYRAQAEGLTYQRSANQLLQQIRNLLEKQGDILKDGYA